MIKEKLTSLDIAVLVRELNDIIKGGIVSNVYMSNSIVLLKVHTKQGKTFILIEVPKRIHITKYEYPIPQTPPAKCMLMRRFIRGKRITKITQPDSERIVIFELEPENIKLVVELVREGNILIVNRENKIVFTLKGLKLKDRKVMVGAEYKPPPSPFIKLDKIDEAYREVIKGKGDIIRNLITKLGIPPELAEEALYRLKIPKDTRIKDIKLETFKRIIKEVEKIREEALTNTKPCIVYDSNNSPQAFFTFTPSYLKGVKIEVYRTLNEALDEYYAKLIKLRMKKLAENKLAVEKERIEKEIKALEHRYESYLKRATTLEKIAKTLLELHHLIRGIKYGYEINELTRRLKEKEIEANIKGNILEVKLGKIRVEINMDANIFEEINRIFNEYKKLKRKAEHILEIIESKRRKLNELGKVEVKEYKLKKIPKEHKRWFEKFKWFITSDGHLVIAGRDRKQNELLVNKYMSKQDIFIHAEIYGAPVVILKTNGKKPSEESIREAAQFAISHSRAWREGLLSMRAYWVYGSQVTKSPPSGEYLPKGAFIIRGRRNYINNIPLELAVGVLEYEGDLKVLCAPKTIFERRGLPYVLICPGTLKKREAAKKIIEILVEKYSKAGKTKIANYLRNIRVEELESIMPPGGVTIIERE